MEPVANSVLQKPTRVEHVGVQCHENIFRFLVSATIPNEERGDNSEVT